MLIAIGGVFIASRHVLGSTRGSSLHLLTDMAIVLGASLSGVISYDPLFLCFL